MNKRLERKGNPSKCVNYIGIRMMDKLVQGRKQFANDVHVGRRVLVATEIHNDPRDVSEEADGYRVGDEAQQNRHHPEADNVVSEVRAVTDDVAQCPHGLLANVRVRRVQEHEKQGYSICFNDSLRYGRCIRFVKTSLINELPGSEQMYQMQCLLMPKLPQTAEQHCKGINSSCIITSARERLL